MGSIKQGILGGFSCKVGNVVGSSWKGIAYMRGLAVKAKNANTLVQQMQRAKFALSVKFMSKINPYIRYGYKNYMAKQTAGNVGLSYMMHNNCIVGEFPNYSIDFSVLKVALGQLKKAEAPNMALSSGTATCTWTDNSGNGNAQPTDLAMVLLYNKDKAEAEYDIGNATRANATLSYTYPRNWTGDTFVAYLSFMLDDGKLVAESDYLGEIIG